jgi:uncharacterized membrane protein
MTGAVPCPDDPAYWCGDPSSGSWWPLVVGVVILAGWLGYRFGRFGGSRRR